MTEIPNTCSSGPRRPARRRPPTRPPPQPAEPAAPRRRRRRRAPRPSEPRIPAHLLERSRAAKAQRRWRRRRRRRAPVAAASPSPDQVASVVAGHAGAAAACPIGAGPGGHTQRLLTVVKSGSIQDVKAHTGRQGAHLAAPAGGRVRRRRSPALAFTFVFSIFVNAPLLQLANPNQTPNPSKAPWYFLGLQELLTMFHPMIAGVTIPGVGLIVLIFAPYIDKNPSQQARGPQVRHLADDRAPHVLGGARHHRLVLPRARASTSRCRGATACSSSCERRGARIMSAAAIIAIAIAVVVVLGAGRVRHAGPPHRRRAAPARCQRRDRAAATAPRVDARRSRPSRATAADVERRGAWPRARHRARRGRSRRRLAPWVAARPRGDRRQPPACSSTAPPSR